MITFYYGSGSPYAWRVWLALEHKALPYELKVLSFSAGDTKKPEFLALNPRHKVPVIVDDGFVLYESTAIIEYLEDRYPAASPAQALWPADIQRRALARRLVAEIENYFDPAQTRLARQAFFVKADARNTEEIAAAADEIARELAFFESAMQGDFLVGQLSAADFALYPCIAMLARIEQRALPELGVLNKLGPRLRAWRQRMEALPYMQTTWPPHWKQASS